MTVDVFHGLTLAAYMPLIPRIRARIDEWRLIEIRRAPDARGTVPYIARKLHQFCGPCEGIIFLCDAESILAFIRTDATMSVQDFTASLTAALPKCDGSMQVAAVTADHLLRIQTGLQEKEAEGAAGDDSSILKFRQDRTDDIVMVVDDDMLMRSLIEKSLSDYANVIALDDIADAIDTYLSELPDMIFMDVHMPGGSGIAALEEILTFDPSAHVVMLSSDTVVDRIMDAKKSGAKGYIAKPFTPEKLLSSYNKCPTVLKRGEG